MKLIFHHLRKDIRVQRWLIALWLLVVLLVGLPNVLMLQADYDGARRMDALRQSPFLSLAAIIVWTMLLARLIQSEPVTGSTSFWLTRPIPRSVYLASKAIFFTGILLLPAIIPYLVGALAYRPEPGPFANQLMSVLVLELVMTVIMLWIATYTSGLLQFGGMLCLGFVGLILFMNTVAEYFMRIGQGRNIGLGFFYVLLPAFLLSLAVQYFSRHSRLALIIGMVGILIGAVAECVIPSDVDPVLGPPWAKRANLVTVDFNPGWASTVTWGTVHYGTERIEPEAQATLVPVYEEPGTTTWVMGASPIFTPQDGTPADLIPSTVPEASFASRPPPPALLREALPGITLDTSKGGWAPSPLVSLFHMTPEVATQLRGKKGELRLDVYGWTAALKLAAVLPLDDPRHIARVPGGFIRFKRVDQGGQTRLILWIVAPDPSFAGNYSCACVLVDPKAGTGKSLQSSGSSSTRGVLSLGAGNEVDTEISYDLARTPDLDRMQLYVFHYQQMTNFNSQLVAPNFVMNPP